MRYDLPFTKEDIERWGVETPFYVYDEQGIRETVEGLRRAFSWNEGFKEYFAVKATPTPGILRLLMSLGCGADCASVPELMLARASGMEMILSSNQTKASEYQTAREYGAIINLDDITQIDNLERSAGIPDTLCFRYNPGDFAQSNEIIGHPSQSKYGLTRSQLLEAYSIAASKGVRHFGLHSMIASCSLDNDYYALLSRLLFELCLEIRKETGVRIEFVDLSGGVGIPYRPEETAVDIDHIGESVRRVYEEIFLGSPLRPRLMTEMGRYITGPHGYLVTRVIGLKHIYKEYVGVDACAADLMRPAIYGAYHHIVVPGRERDEALHRVDVVGSLCENNDKFAIDRMLPALDIGDYIVIEDAGAHGHSMGYNYNGKLRSAEYLMDRDRELHIMRRAQTAADLFSTLDVDKDFHM